MESRNGPKGTAIHLSWASWSDQAFKHQLTLVNWFPDRPYPGDSTFKLKKLSGEDVNQAVATRKRAAEFPEDVDLNAVLRIISWSDGTPYLAYHFILCSLYFAEERSLSLEHQKNVPLIIDANGKILLMVKDSKKYLRQIAPGKCKARKTSKHNIVEPANDEEPAVDQPESHFVRGTPLTHLFISFYFFLILVMHSAPLNAHQVV